MKLLRYTMDSSVEVSRHTIMLIIIDCIQVTNGNALGMHTALHTHDDECPQQASDVTSLVM